MVGFVASLVGFFSIFCPVALLGITLIERLFFFGPLIKISCACHMVQMTYVCPVAAFSIFSCKGCRRGGHAFIHNILEVLMLMS